MARRLPLLVLAVVAVALAVPLGTAPQASTRTISAVDSVEGPVVRRINQVRAAHGLKPLRTSGRLARAADGHSRAMARHGFFAHESRDGTAFWQRVRRAYTASGYASWTVGETLLWRTSGVTAAQAVRLWMKSPPHRKVLLGRAWREVGIGAIRVTAAPGVYRGHDVVILTADFGSRS